MPLLRRPRSPVLALRRLAAALLAATALVLALRSPEPAAVGGPHLVAVAVAAADLPAGAVLTGADLTTARLPAEAVPRGAVADPHDLAGRRLAGGVRSGEPLTDVRLVGPGLTAGLPAGQVAAPVRLADLAVAGLVRTGDRVDVLATAPDAGTAEVVAAGALVLAATAPPGDAATASEDAGLLVLAVDAATAARLAAVATTATLTVSLPPP
ncbi:Flp pilus assembly protein CpaB [Geodermatophilus sp. SYSU D00815]